MGCDTEFGSRVWLPSHSKNHATLAACCMQMVRGAERVGGEVHHGAQALGEAWRHPEEQKLA